MSELSGDVDRHLKAEPVLAGPPSTFYKLGKLARRHRAAAAALLVTFVALAVSAVVSTLSLVRALRAEDGTRRQLIGSLVAEGMQRVDAADPLTGLLYLTRALELETDDARTRNHRIRIGETLQRSPRLAHLWRHDAAITMLAMSQGGLIATGSTDGAIKLRTLSSAVQRELDQGGEILDGEFSRDGTLLVVASEDGSIRIWIPQDGVLLRELGRTGHLRDVALSPDANVIAAIHENGEVRAWDRRSGRIHFDGHHSGRGRRAVFSNSGSLLATAGDDGVRLWHVPTGLPSAFLRHEGTFAGRMIAVHDVAFAENDRWLATAGTDFTARIWDLRTARQVGEAMRHEGIVNSVTFADGSRLLVTTSIDQTTRVWRVPAGTPVAVRERAKAFQRLQT